MLHRVDAGERGLGAPGRVLVHEDRQVSRVGARARSARRVGSHGHIELDGIHARVRQRIDLGLRIRRVEPTAEAGESRVHLAFLQHRSCEENARAGPRSGFDQGAIARDVVKLAAEVEHRGDAGGQEELGMPFLGRVHVDVHVHEPRSDELPLAIDDRGAPRNRCRRRRPDRDNPVTLDQDRRVLDGRASGAVENGGAGNRQPGDFSHAINPSFNRILLVISGVLPTGLSTAVHNSDRGWQ